MNSVAYVNNRISELQDQILGMHRFAIQKGLGEAETAALIRPYHNLIRSIYMDDMPFARTMDDSDLVIRAQGPMVAEHATHLNSVDTLFSVTRKQVQRLAKAIAGISDVMKPIPNDVDLLLTGTAPGSFIFGVSIPATNSDSKQLNHISQEDDPVYAAMRDALRNLSIISLHVNDNIDDAGLAKDVPDPAVRDALMSVAVDLSPSGRSGIDRISLYSQSKDYDRVRPLTPDTRRLFRARVNEPLKRTTRGEFIGTVREIDLDAKRFEIRGVKDGIGGIRCILTSLTKDKANSILGTPVKVSGSYITNAAGKPRLMEVDKITTLPKNIQESLL